MQKYDKKLTLQANWNLLLLNCGTVIKLIPADKTFIKIQNKRNLKEKVQ